MNRLATLLLVSSLGFAGCAHDHALTSSTSASARTGFCARNDA